MKVENLTLNKLYKIVDINMDDILHSRLNDVGIFEGAIIRVIRKSLLAESFVLGVHGVQMAIRGELIKGVHFEEYNASR